MAMIVLLLTALTLQPPQASGDVQQLEFVTREGTMTYGLWSRGDSRRTPRPLVLALHPGGPRAPGVGTAFMRDIVLPALGRLDAIVVAPDSPGRSWTDPAVERAVMALVADLMERDAVDRRRVLVTGFSMGGRGAWFMASRHADVFTAAIPMAASAGDEPSARLGTQPTYVVHSRDDQVVPFAPADAVALDLQRQGKVVRFEALSGVGHYEMGHYVDSLARAIRWVVERWND